MKKLTNIIFIIFEKYRKVYMHQLQKKRYVEL